MPALLPPRRAPPMREAAIVQARALACRPASAAELGGASTIAGGAAIPSTHIAAAPKRPTRGTGVPRVEDCHGDGARYRAAPSTSSSSSSSAMSPGTT